MKRSDTRFQFCETTHQRAVFVDMQHADFTSPNQSMDNYLLRLATYNNLPDWAVLSPMKAAKSGLYYTGEGDTVACYSCGLRLNHWESGVHPMTVHRQLSPGCQFVVSQPTDDVSAEQDVSSTSGTSPERQQQRRRRRGYNSRHDYCRRISPCFQ